MKKTTIKDIAFRAGVSHVTVSKVINNKGSISVATAEKIRRIIKQCEYIPSLAAVNLARGKTNTIAIVVPGLSRGFVPEVMEGVQGVLNKTEFQMSIFSTGAKGSGEKIAYDRIINGRIADVVIIVSNCPDDATIKRFNNVGIPLILLESKRPKTFSIKVDNVKGAERAVLYLASKNRKDIGLIVGDTRNIESQKERMQGYKNTLKKLGMPFRKELVYGTRLHLYEDGKSAAETFMKRKVDAVFCAAGDYVAYGLMEGIGKANISIIGYDDLKTSSGMGLTTMRQPLFKMGEAAFKMAEKLMGRGNDNPTDILFEPDLIIRKSA